MLYLPTLIALVVVVLNWREGKERVSFPLVGLITLFHWGLMLFMASYVPYSSRDPLHAASEELAGPMLAVIMPIFVYQIHLFRTESIRDLLPRGWPKFQPAYNPK